MGKKLPFYFIREYIFWLLFLALCRSIFLLYNTDELKEIPLPQTLAVFINAIYLDTSMICYVLGISFFFYLFAELFRINFFLKINSAYTMIIIVLYSLLAIAELEIYNEWGKKIDVKAIKFLEHPGEAINSVRTGFLILGIIGVIILTGIGIFLRKKITPHSKSLSPAMADRQGEGLEKRSWVTLILFFILTPGILFLGIRGGTQQIPIQTSDAYFSKYNILNLAAVNTGWNLVHSITDNIDLLEGNPFQYYDLNEAKKIVEEIHEAQKDTTVQFLTTNRPNIILVILEGWSADLVHSFGGDPGATPHFEKLVSEGVICENTYSSGSLSDQGMCCIFSAFPAQPLVNIISQPDKYNQLPCITKEIKQAGYTTSFLFGGQLSYGNIRSYMYFNNFDRILEGKDFDSDLPRGKLGVHDEHLYARQLQELRNEKEPFFAAMFTMSSHSPYDHGMEEKIHWGGDERKYVNAVYYSDMKLYEFIEKAKKEKWFGNTLFIILSDHGHRSHRHYFINQPEYRRIPFLFYGNVIKEEFKGYKNNKITSQIDLAAVLLNQLGIPSLNYTWSKNVFNPHAPEFAWYETTDGFGYVTPGQYLVYSHPSNTFTFEQTKSPGEKLRLEKEGKSYLQILMQEYSDY